MASGPRRATNPVPGTGVAGFVEAVGARVTRFLPGDEVFGETVWSSVRGHQARAHPRGTYVLIGHDRCDDSSARRVGKVVITV